MEYERQKYIVIEDEYEYRFRAFRQDAGSFIIVFVEWEHPNYGYFADAMLWVRSMHMTEWKPLHIANWTKGYKTSKDFIKHFPEFRELFKIRKTAFPSILP